MKKTATVTISTCEFLFEDEAYSILSDFMKYLEKKGKEKSFLIELENEIALEIQKRLPEEQTVVDEFLISEIILFFSKLHQIKYLQFKKIKVDTKKTQKLHRNTQKQIIGGVCAGIAEQLNIDPVFIRLIFVLAVFYHLSGIPIYLIMWIALPNEKQAQQNEVFEKFAISNSKN